MSIEELITKANQISKPSQETHKEYSEKRETLVEAMNHKLSLNYNLATLIGGIANTSMMKDNHQNHSRFMENLFANYNSKTFVDTIIWAFRAYQAHGFPQSYWSAQYSSWCDVLRDNLSETGYKEIYPFYNYIIVNMAHFFTHASATPPKSTTAAPSQHT